MYVHVHVNVLLCHYQLTDEDVYGDIGHPLLVDVHQPRFLSRSVLVGVHTERLQVLQGAHRRHADKWDAQDGTHPRQDAHDGQVKVVPHSLLELVLWLVDVEQTQLVLYEDQHCQLGKEGGDNVKKVA